MIRYAPTLLALTCCAPEGDPSFTNQGGESEVGNRSGLPPPEAYIRPEDQERARRNDPNDIPCTSVGTENGFEIISGVPTDECFRMLPARRYEGLWRNDFEGSRFCPAPVQECTFESKGISTWLSFAQRLPPREMEGRGGLYAVEFDGRRTLHRGGHGHLGMSDHELIVDRLISIREVEPPPPEPTEAELREEWRRCEAAGMCTPPEKIEELLKEAK